MSPSRLRSLRRPAAALAVAAVVYAVSLVLAFPYDRAKDRFVALLASEDLDADVGSAGPILGFGIAMDRITLRTRPIPPAKPSRMVVDRARLTFSPLALLRGGMAWALDMETLGGRVDFSRRLSKAEARTTLRARSVDVGELPWVKESINLPLGGTLELTGDLTLPGRRYAEANGAIEWKCAGCALGDGKEKLKIASNPLLAEGISMPRIRLGDFVGRIAFEKGVGKLQGVRAKSPDAEIVIEGEIDLRDPLPASTFRAYVQFKLSDALVKGDDKLQILLQLAEAGKRSDGFYGANVHGSFGRLDPPVWSRISSLGIGAPSAPTVRPHILPARFPPRTGDGLAPILQPRSAIELEPPPPASPAPSPTSEPPAAEETPPPAPSVPPDETPVRAPPVPAPNGEVFRRLGPAGMVPFPEPKAADKQGTDKQGQPQEEDDQNDQNE